MLSNIRGKDLLKFKNDQMVEVIILTTVFLIYGLGVAILLTFLTVYHFCLIIANETTQEEIRDKYKTWGGNPYNMGRWSKKNFDYFWYP